jgi:nicotinamide-nucleotide amidase
MARGVRDRLGATYGVATTGEAGPDSGSGRPVGTVFIAVAGPQGTTTRLLDSAGTREQIQRAAVTGALRALGEVLDSSDGGAPAGGGLALGNNGD